jgi:hypothetical protein
MSIKRLVANALMLGLGMVLVGLVPGDADGQELKKKHDRELIAELNTIHLAIRSANHNYKGHRAKAMTEVNRAVRQLARDAGKKMGKAKGMRGGPGKGKKNALPQAESDALLRNAKRALAGVLSQLSALPASGHRTSAAKHIKHAMEQLDKALAVR